MAKSENKNKATGKAPRGGKCLADLPEIMKAWDSTRNDEDPKSLHPGTPKKAYWSCENGHSYWRSIRLQTSNGLFCPTCNSFGHHYPELIDSWHPKNNKSPFDVSKASGRKVWWLCEHNHGWQSAVYSRVNHGCPTCAGQTVTSENSFAIKKPELAKFWNSKKNKITPEQVAWQSNKRCWFVCERGHEFSATLNNVSNGKWCPYCAGKKVGYGNSLQDINPSLAAEWNNARNEKGASSYAPHSNKKVWWICSKQHEWEAAINSRNSGSGCPFCVNRSVGYGNSLQDLYPKIAAEINHAKSPCKPSEIGAKSSVELWWKCDRGHTWKAPVKRRTSEKRGCPSCSNQTSMPEIRLFTELKSIFPETLSREKVHGYELDICLPNLKIGIEYDGAYYHKDRTVQDKQKSDALDKIGYTIFRLREEPLGLSSNDVRVASQHNAPTKNEVNKLLLLISQEVPEVRDICDAYIKARLFLADEEFRRICSYLPGPPEEESLAEVYPELAVMWHEEKNHPLKPSMFHPHSGKKVWWICSLGHEWEATIDKRAGAGRGCPYCTNKKVGYGNSLADRYPEIAKLWYQPQNGNLTPDKVTFGSGKKVWWECENGHIHQARVVDKTAKGRGCRFCPGIGKNHKYTAPIFGD